MIRRVQLLEVGQGELKDGQGELRDGQETIGLAVGKMAGALDTHIRLTTLWQKELLAQVGIEIKLPEETR
jgi:hypothetical protein